jgi:hypothetical protein
VTGPTRARRALDAARGPAADVDELDRRVLYAPDGAPWCRFGRGLSCSNAGACRNPAHRSEELDPATP